MAKEKQKTVEVTLDGGKKVKVVVRKPRVSQEKTWFFFEKPKFSQKTKFFPIKTKVFLCFWLLWVFYLRGLKSGLKTSPRPPRTFKMLTKINYKSSQDTSSRGTNTLSKLMFLLNFYKKQSM